MYKNDLLLKALARQPVERVPLWIMRQAGRYLPEYREVRKQSDFFTMVRTPELAAKVTLQPIERFKLDAAIIFSDILVIPQALGLEVLMEEGSGPSFPRPISGPSDITALKSPKLERDLGYVFDAIALSKRELQGQVPLIGFAGAPWTLLFYMLGCSSSKSAKNAKKFLFTETAAAIKLLELLTEVTSDYLLAQIESGAAAVQLFDSWAGELGPEDYSRFAVPYIAKIVERVVSKAPLIIFAKGAHYALRELAQTGASALGIDWTIVPQEARRLAPNLALQGNLDPCALHLSVEEIRSRTKTMIESFGTRGYIANLGHGITPDIDPEKVAVFVEAVKEFSQTAVA